MNLQCFIFWSKKQHKNSVKWFVCVFAPMQSNANDVPSHTLQVLVMIRRLGWQLHKSGMCDDVDAGTWIALVNNNLMRACLCADDERVSLNKVPLDTHPVCQTWRRSVDSVARAHCGCSISSVRWRAAL